MKKKTIVIFLLILLIIFSGGCIKKTGNQNVQPTSTPKVTIAPEISQTSGVPSSDVPSDVPPEYRDKYIKNNNWLDSKLVEWAPARLSHSLMFNGHLVLSSENLVESSNSDVDLKFFDMINDLNTDTISLFIYPDLFEKYEQRYDTLINKIKASNKKVYIAYMVEGNSKFLDFKDYKDTEMTFTKTFVEKYHPDYYVVADEITTMNKRIGINITDDEWRELVIEAVNLVKKSSPQTKTVVTGHSGELSFLKSLVDVNNIDFIGLNIWGIELLDDTTVIGKNLKNTIEYFKLNGKDVILEQTWTTLMDSSQASKKLSRSDFMIGLDEKYIKVLGYYAYQNNVSIYSPFYTGKFVSYNPDTNVFSTALNTKKWTPVYQSYKDLIQQFKSLPKE